MYNTKTTAIILGVAALCLSVALFEVGRWRGSKAIVVVSSVLGFVASLLLAWGIN